MTQHIPPIIHLAGGSAAGATALITRLISLLAARGYRVAGLTGSPDAPQPAEPAFGSAAAFRAAGAARAGMITAHQIIVAHDAAPQPLRAEHLPRLFSDCHLILMHGALLPGSDIVEVVPADDTPSYAGNPRLRAVLSTTCAVPGIPCFAPDAVEQLCGFVEQRYLKPHLSAAVLAGGMSRRLGSNKALLELNGTLLIERVLKTVGRFAAHATIITNDSTAYRHLGVATAPDIKPGGGPLSGIHAALSLSATEYVLVVSCDMPLLDPGHIAPLIAAYPGFDITLYKHQKFEPLCAVYRRSCISALEELIEHGEYRIIDLFPTLNVQVIRTADARPFKSINTLDDYDEVLKIMHAG